LTPLLGQAGEKDLYDFLWLDPDKKVYVLQNKIYQKNKTFYLDFGYISNMTSAFEDTNGVQLKFGYYFKEEWALEFNYNQYGSQTNSTYESVKVVNDSEPFTRRVNKIQSLFLIWSPFYGKINTFNKIFYFDWSFGIGFGEMKAESNLNSVRNPGSANTFISESYNPIQFKSNVKFHINKRIHLGVEFLNSNYEAGSPKNPGVNEWKQSNDLIFSLGVSF
jgi:outer membrane beta-barrel protein